MKKFAIIALIIIAPLLTACDVVEPTVPVSPFLTPIIDIPDGAYTEGQYLAGKDINSGVYMLVADEGRDGYWATYLDDRGIPSGTVYTNNSFKYFTLVNVQEGRWLKVSAASFFELQESMGLPTIGEYLPEGMYIVGKDFPEGEYQLKIADSNKQAVWYIYTSVARISERLGYDDMGIAKEDRIIILNDGEVIRLENLNISLAPAD